MDIVFLFLQGMVHAGMGATHVNAFLTSLNIPAVSSKTLKKHEHAVGVEIEKVAKKSCEATIATERELEVQKRGLDVSDSDNVGIAVSYDMGWQKRGRAHNSLTGRYSISKYCSFYTPIVRWIILCNGAVYLSI